MAGFLGVANLFPATAKGADGGGRCRLRLGDFDLEAAGGDTAASGEVRVVIRPEVELEGATADSLLDSVVQRVPIPT